MHPGQACSGQETGGSGALVQSDAICPSSPRVCPALPAAPHGLIPSPPARFLVPKWVLLEFLSPVIRGPSCPSEEGAWRG